MNQPFALDAADANALAAAALALARRFAAGATLWCVAPDWPEHARHVAVEFVHPVIVGKRALPAVAVSGPPIETLRLAVRPGDVILVAGRGAATDLASRAHAWGASVISIAGGPAPHASHVIRVDTEAPRYDGQLVLRYHLLWELTHVCLEHPGLLETEAGDDEVCVTCRDEGRIGEVAAVVQDGLVDVRTQQGHEEIDATLVGAVCPGDLLLIHAGTAIGRVDG